MPTWGIRRSADAVGTVGPDADRAGLGAASAASSARCCASRTGWSPSVECSSGSPYAGSGVAPRHESRARFIQGFVISSLVFCVGPLTILGSIDEGLGKGADQLLLKAALDGFAAIAFAAAYGWGVGASVIVLVVVQGRLTALGAVAGQLRARRPPQRAHRDRRPAARGGGLAAARDQAGQGRRPAAGARGRAPAHRAGGRAQVAGPRRPPHAGPVLRRRPRRPGASRAAGPSRSSGSTGTPRARRARGCSWSTPLARSTCLRVSSRSLRSATSASSWRSSVNRLTRHLDRRHQVGLVERLDQVGHRAGVACPLDQVALAEGGQDHHRRDPGARRSARPRRSRRGAASSRRG